MEDRAKKQFLAAYDSYADALYRHCFFRVFSKARAEELVQETFMRAWVYMEAGNAVANTRAFLYRVANNLIIDHARKKKEESLDALLEESDAYEPAYEGHKQIEKNILIGEVKEAMENLSDSDRGLLIKRYVDDLDPKEIAEILQTNANNVSVKIHRAIKTLKRYFHRETKEA